MMISDRDRCHAGIFNDHVFNLFVTKTTSTCNVLDDLWIGWFTKCLRLNDE